MDKETQIIVSKQKRLQALIGSDGWNDVRQMFTDRILGLQNISSIDLSNVEQLVIDLNVNKKTAELLFDILREIEGTASEYEPPVKENSYIVRG